MFMRTGKRPPDRGATLMGRLFLFPLVFFLLSSCGGAVASRTASFGANTPPLVTFVFDDGDDTDYLVGKKIFSDHGAVACSAITTGWINTEDHMTAAQIRSLRDAGWEILSHTVSHPNLNSLSPDEIDAELTTSKSELDRLGLPVKNLVYPFNKNNETVRSIAGKYYRSARGGTNSLNVGVSDPFFLKSFSMKHDVARMKKHIDTAFVNKNWLIFYQHEIDAQVKLEDKQGSFIKGETLRLSPSGTVARYVTVHWFPVYGFSLYLVPFSGVPQPGDLIRGEVSGATARVDYVIYNELTQLAEMIRYIQTSYPSMRIVTIDQGLDLLGVPDRVSDMKKVSLEK